MTVLQLISHTPGPTWVDGVSFREQPGVEHHLATMRGWVHRRTPPSLPPM